MKNQKGFALMEMVVVIAVLGIVTAASAGYFYAAKVRHSREGYRPVTPPTVQSNTTVTVQLEPQNGSTRSGVAFLTEVNGKVKVALDLSGSSEGIERPAHIHYGVCPAVGAVRYPLENLVDGSSTTTLDVSLSGLLNQLPLAINIHKSTDEPGVYLACGNLKPLTLPLIAPGPR